MYLSISIYLDLYLSINISISISLSICIFRVASISIQDGINVDSHTRRSKGLQRDLNKIKKTRELSKKIDIEGPPRRSAVLWRRGCVAPSLESTLD